MDGDKGEWANGQILILSKQEDKDNKWKVDEIRNSVCPIRPMHFEAQGNGSKCSYV